MARWVSNMRWLIGGLGALASAGISNYAQAQDGAYTELYGYAVHRYYAGDYNEAQRVLNMVIDAGIEDPRPHFFRGLTTYQMGMQDAAKSDFDRAAELEAKGKGTTSVSQALQRIQGPVRRDIEMARMMARVAVTQEQRAKKEMEATQAQANPSVAKPPAGNSLPPALDAAPAAQPPAATTEPVAPATPDTQTDPFKDDAAVPAPGAPAAPAADPFGTAPATPAAPAADPFGAAPATPAAPTTPAVDDPFK